MGWGTSRCTVGAPDRAAVAAYSSTSISTSASSSSASAGASGSESSASASRSNSSAGATSSSGRGVLVASGLSSTSAGVVDRKSKVRICRWGDGDCTASVGIGCLPRRSNSCCGRKGFAFCRRRSR